jgi:hypothetical protein
MSKPVRACALTEKQTRDLLKLAGVPSSHKAAVDWLSKAIAGARHNYAAAKERPLAADHNALLVDIEKSAKKLIKGIERLRRHPSSWRAFWRSSDFGPVHLDRVELREVLSTLNNIVRVADAAKDPRKGRRREAGKQHVVNLAFGFFVRFSPHRPSGTPTGAFAEFARTFYVAATGIKREKNGRLDRQIRQALTGLSIERQRAQRKSVEKPKDSS